MLLIKRTLCMIFISVRNVGPVFCLFVLFCFWYTPHRNWLHSSKVPVDSIPKGEMLHHYVVLNSDEFPVHLRSCNHYIVMLIPSVWIDKTRKGGFFSTESNRSLSLKKKIKGHIWKSNKLFHFKTMLWVLYVIYIFKLLF